MKSESEAANVWLGIGVNQSISCCVCVESYYGMMDYIHDTDPGVNGMKFNMRCSSCILTICDRRVIDGNCDACWCWQRGTVTKGYQWPCGYSTKWIKWIYCIIYIDLYQGRQYWAWTEVSNLYWFTVLPFLRPFWSFTRGPPCHESAGLRHWRVPAATEMEAIWSRRNRVFTNW